MKLPEGQVARVEFDMERLRALQEDDPRWRSEMERLGVLVWGAFQLSPEPVFVLVRSS